MAPGLQEERIGDDGADSREGEPARDHILWTMHQDAHRKSALRFDRHRVRFAAAAATLHLIVVRNLFRHFSSTEGFDRVLGYALLDSAWRTCLVVAVSSVLNLQPIGRQC